MEEYVVGFAFNSDGDKVILIEKQKPNWQKGKLNGTGGLIEDIDMDETHNPSLNIEPCYLAMAREFKEEAGIETSYFHWDQFCVLTDGRGWKVYFLRTHLLDPLFDLARTTTKEKIVKIKVKELNQHKIIPNLEWLIPLALDKDVRKVVVKEYVKQ